MRPARKEGAVMTATAKKLLSIFLAFTLVFAFTPTVAMGEGAGTSNETKGLEANDDPAPTGGAGDEGEAGGKDGKSDGGEAVDLQPATLNGLAAQDAGGESENADAEAAADGQAAAMTAQADKHVIQGDTYNLTWELYTNTYEIGGEEKSTTGAIITDVNVGSASADVGIPETVEDGENTYSVIGVGKADGNKANFSNAGNVGAFTLPSSIQFVNIDFHQNVKGEVVFRSSAAGNENPITTLQDSFFSKFYGPTVTLPNKLTSISSMMFQDSYITSITLPASVKQINLNAFTGTKNLATVTLNEGLEVIGQEAFAPSLGNGVYFEASDFTSIAIPSTVREIQQEAFRKDTALATVDFGSASGLQTIGDYAFYGTSLTSVSIPDSVQTIGNGAFSGKNHANTMEDDLNPNSQGSYTLTSVNLGAGLTTLGSGAFAYQPITSVAIPENLTTLGYDTSTYQFVDQYGVYHLGGTIGAFSMCDQLQTVTWPASSSLTAVGGFDGCTSLTADAVNSLPASVKRIDDYAFYNCTSMDTVVVPSTVTSIGKGAFSKHDATASGKTFTLLNKEVTLGGWTSADPTTGPWPLGCGYTIKYPRSAAADSSIVQYRNAVEAYETAQSIAEANRTKFETVADDFYTVTGTVPEGASVTLIAGDKEYHPELDSNNSFTTELIEGGTYVGAVVSLDGYLDYQISPDNDQTVARIGTDWIFTVTKDQMTPLSQAGMIQVSGRGAYRAECNIAVFTSAGKLVSQGGALRVSQHPTAETAPIYVVDAVPAGTYTVVAWQKNDYFSRISSLGDFAAMGFTEGDYAKADVTVPAGGAGSITLDIPQLDTSKISGILATGDVYVTSSYTPPAVPFVLTVNYEMTTGQSVDSVQVNIPAGMVPLAAASAEKDYSDAIAAWVAPADGASAATLTIGNLADADKQSGTIAVSLKANEAGTYAVGASLKSGSITAPLGAATVECPDIKLVVPKGTLASREFDVHVYARPNSEITLKIGDTELSVDEKTLSASCKTNLIGHAKVTVKIPDEELSSTYYHEVTATTKVNEKDVSDSALVQYAAYLDGVPLEPTIYNFSFDSAGETYDLVKDGKDLSGGYYIFGVHENNFTRVMPFTVQIDSLQPLDNGAMLYLGMLDNSVKAYDMNLSDSVELPNGAMRYTYKVVVPTVEGDDFSSDMVPCRFDVATKPREVASSTVKPQLTAANVDVLTKGINEDAWALNEAGRQSFEKFCESYPKYKRLLSGQAVLDWAKGEGWNTQQAVDNLKMLSDGGYDWSLGVFNNSFRHEKWYTAEEWNALDQNRRQWLLECESATVAAFDYLAGLLGNSKPMYKYASFEEYVAEEYGFTDSGSTMAADLEKLGYTVVYDTSGNLKQPAAEYDSSWYNEETGKITWPEPTSSGKAWLAANLPALEGASDFGADESALTAQQADPRESDDIDAVSNFGNDLHYILANMPKQRSQKARDANAVKGNLLTLIGTGYTDQVGKDAMLMRGLASAVSLYTAAIDAETSVQDYSDTANELAKREDELNRMKWMYEMHVNNGVKDAKCADALKQEMEYLKAHISDLKRKAFIQAYTGTVGTVAGEVAAGAGVAAEALQASALAVGVGSGGTAAVPAGELEAESKICGAISLGATAVGVANAAGSMVADKLFASHDARNKDKLDNYRYYREWECKKTDFGKLHYNKKPIIDPSGFTYEGVEDNRVSDVIATIYQKVGTTGTDADWEPWNAAEADQVNPQNTTSTGLFAWDVPEGDWKVRFQKAGYDDVWSQVMHVLPEWTNVAINMLRADPPTGTNAAVNADDPESPYVDITFDQYMKASADFAPTVTVGGKPVTNATWVNVVAGTDEAGSEAPLSRTLRVPLAGLVEPGDTATVTVADAYSYAGKQMAAPYSATVTVPDNATYYYVAPDEVATYTKGSNKALKFTFKRSSYDNRTFDRFEGILMDGTAVDASNYKAEAGSAVITLSASYLESLAEGDHMLTAQFADGSADAAFKVVAATKASKTRGATPNTGDKTAPMGLLLFTAALACAVMLVARNRANAYHPVGKHAKR